MAAKLEEKLAERDAQLASLSARVHDIEHKMALANKQILGPKSERMPTPQIGRRSSVTGWSKTLPLRDMRLQPPPIHPFTGLVMSLGAGFYEELAFRALLFGVGAKVLVWIFARQKVGLVGSAPRLSLTSLVVMGLWALACAAAFSGMHYVGPLADPFDIQSFVARAVLGLMLTLVYAMRGFAVAVWTHALYDVWVLVL
jgi:hypothetical protein